MISMIPSISTGVRFGENRSARAAIARIARRRQGTEPSTIVIRQGGSGSHRTRNLIVGSLASLAAIVGGAWGYETHHNTQPQQIDSTMNEIRSVEPQVNDAGDNFVKNLNLPPALKPIIQMSGLQQYGEGAGPILFLASQLYLY